MGNFSNSSNSHQYLGGQAKMIWKQEQKVTEVTEVTVLKQKYFRTQSKPLSIDTQIRRGNGVKSQNTESPQTDIYFIFLQTRFFEI